MLVKICGIQQIAHAHAAADAGADMIGVVFAPSRRQVTEEQAMAIATALHARVAKQHVAVVGLFVNETAATINHVVQRCHLDYVQLSGDETPQDAYHICCPVMKSLRLDGSDTEAAWLAHVRHANQQQEPLHGAHTPHTPLTFAPCPIIIDAHVAGAYGGTGTLADWQRAALFTPHYRCLLAGGLHPDNVAEAIQHVHPYGVDVSSGVETHGIKDVSLIAAFIQRVRSHPQNNENTHAERATSYK